MKVRRTGSSEYGRYIKALICGNPGSGKTLISSTFPEPLYASAEGGLMSIADRNIPFVEIESSHELQQIQVALAGGADTQNRHFGFEPKTIVVDTIDEVARILIRERLAETRKDTLAMQDWGWLGDQLRALIRSFRGLPMNVVFTCHLKSTEDSETGRMFFKPAIQGAVGDEIAGYVDLAVLLDARLQTVIADGESKRVQVRRLVTAMDTNYPWIKDRSGKLPGEFPVNFTDDYGRMHDLIYGSIPTDVEQPVVVDLEQVTEDIPPVLDESEMTLQSVLSAVALRAMDPKEKLATDGPWECETCTTVVTNPDQRDLSVMKTKAVACPTCLNKK